MARELRNLKLDRVDLVAAPANPGARVLLSKAKDRPASLPLGLTKAEAEAALVRLTKELEERRG